MYKKKTGKLYKQTVKYFLLLNIAFLLLSLSLSQAIPVGSRVQFHTDSGYFTFSNLLTANSIISVNNGWKLTSIQLTGDDESLSYAWIYLSTGHMTITHLIYKNRFHASVTAPSGTLVTIKIKLSKWVSETPKSIKINNKYYKVMARSLQEFNSAPYTTWYWQSGILYLKVKTSSTVPIIVDWAQAPPQPSPPAPPSPPSPPTPTPPTIPKGIIENIIDMINQFANQVYVVLSTLTLTTWIILAIVIMVIVIIIRGRE